MLIFWRHHIRFFDVSCWCRGCRMDTPRWCHEVEKYLGFASICTPFCRCQLGLRSPGCQILRIDQILLVWWVHGQNGGEVLADRRHCWSPDLHLQPLSLKPLYNDFYVHLYVRVEGLQFDQYMAYCKDHKLPNNISCSFCRNLSTTSQIFFQWWLLELATASDRSYILCHCTCLLLLEWFQELVVLNCLAGYGY